MRDLKELQLLVMRGWRLFPCVCNGKVPMIRHWRHLASSHFGDIERWTVECPGCNWGVVTGPKSGVFVLDVDGAAGRQSLAKLESEHTPLPITLSSQTGRVEGGHLFYRYPSDRRIGCTASKLGQGLDVRGDGGYVIVPPSLHPSSCAYRWVNIEQAVATAPGWLLDALESVKPRDSSSPILEGILSEGRRNHSLFRQGCTLRRKGWTKEQIAQELSAANELRCRPPLPRVEIQKIASSAARYEPGGPDPLEKAWELAQKESETGGYGLFLSLVRNLQRSRPGQPIVLPLQRIGRMMKRDWTQARRWRQRATREGRLLLTEPAHWRSHRSALYLFTDVPVSLSPSGLVVRQKQDQPDKQGKKTANVIKVATEPNERPGGPSDL